MNGLIRPPPAQAASGSTRPKAGSSRERVDPATTGSSRERIKPREARLPRPRIDSTARGPIHDFILPDDMWSLKSKVAPRPCERTALRLEEVWTVVRLRAAAVFFLILYHLPRNTQRQ